MAFNYFVTDSLEVSFLIYFSLVNIDSRALRTVDENARHYWDEWEEVEVLFNHIAHLEATAKWRADCMTIGGLVS